MNKWINQNRINQNRIKEKSWCSIFSCALSKLWCFSLWLGPYSAAKPGRAAEQTGHPNPARHWKGTPESTAAFWICTLSFFFFFLPFLQLPFAVPFSSTLYNSIRISSLLLLCFSVSLLLLPSVTLTLCSETIHSTFILTRTH